MYSEYDDKMRHSNEGANLAKRDSGLAHTPKGQSDKHAASADIAIRVQGLSKCYEIYETPRHRLLQMIWRGRRQYYREYWALRNVCFEVKKGDTVGIIGRNGAGKSTLLQLICGTLAPTSGTLEINGRIAALLELGAGFNPEFTGRENVYMNGMVLGLTPSQISERFDSIVAFSEIGQFIDQPVKSYSSGMYVRLAFSVIAHVDADILVIDEALSVGDVYFQQKCMRFIRKFQEDGGTILFVSHDTTTVLSICNSAVMLSPGGNTPPITGPAETLCKQYLSEHYNDLKRQHEIKQQKPPQEDLSSDVSHVRTNILKAADLEKNIYAISFFKSDAESFGDGGATIVDAGFFDDKGERLATVTGGQSVQFVVRLLPHQRIRYPAIGLMLKDRLGQYLYTEGTDLPFRHHHLMLEPNEVVETVFQFKMPILIRGKYTMNVAVAEGLGDNHIQHHWIHDAITIESISGPVVHGIGGLLDMEITIRFPQTSQKVVA